MCSIICGFDNIESLVKLNQHRGGFSHSYSEFDRDGCISIYKSFGEFNNKKYLSFSIFLTFV